MTAKVNETSKALFEAQETLMATNLFAAVEVRGIDLKGRISYRARGEGYALGRVTRKNIFQRSWYWFQVEIGPHIQRVCPHFTKSTFGYWLDDKCWSKTFCHTCHKVLSLTSKPLEGDDLDLHRSFTKSQ